MTTTPTSTAALLWTRDAGIAVGTAIAITARRLYRTMRAVIAVSRKHLPKWLAGLLAIALAIPGPQDELVVLLIIGVFVAFKPAMRADLSTAIQGAWTK